MVSFLIDINIVFIISYVYFVFMYTFFGGDLDGNYNNEVLKLVDYDITNEVFSILNILLVYVLYLTFSYMNKRGQTIGNILLSLKLVDKKQGNKFVRLLLRNILFVCTFGLIYLFSIKDKDKGNASFEKELGLLIEQV